VAWTGVARATVEVFAMSRFFVGQRVRFIRARTMCGALYQGLAARIILAQPSMLLQEDADFGIQIEGSSESGAVREWQIEPIVPDGHRASDYSLAELLDRCNQGEGVLA